MFFEIVRPCAVFEQRFILNEIITDVIVGRILCRKGRIFPFTILYKELKIIEMTQSMAEGVTKRKATYSFHLG